MLGDLMLDVVVAPARALESGTDVPGRISLVQGGSAANTARWLGRLGARSSLITAVGRDATGRVLVETLRGDGVTPRVVRVPGARTGRIGVLVAADGERSFVADRGAADHLRPEDLRAAWFSGADALHLPVYSLLGEPLGDAGRRAIELAREAGALVSVDLASIGPLLADGRRSARALIAEVAPDLLFATASEAAALLGGRSVDGLLEFAAAAVVKRGPKGATVLARVGDGHHPLRGRHGACRRGRHHRGRRRLRRRVPGRLVRGAGRGAVSPASLQRAAVAGHRAATRQLSTPRAELPLG